MTMASSPPLTNVRPSAVNVTLLTLPQCACCAASNRPLSKSHSYTV